MALSQHRGRLTAESARAAIKVLPEQERVFHCESVGVQEDLELGGIVISLGPVFGEGTSVTITHEADGVAMIQWVADDKDAKSLFFAEGKRKAALEVGHASLWAQLVTAATSGDVASI